MNVIERLPEGTDLGFGKYFAPQMLYAEYTDGRWSPARLTSVKDFHIAPAARVLHYAQEIFEGLKAFRQTDGSIAMFRPLENIRRMAVSSDYLAMPVYPEKDFLNGLCELVRTSKHLVPKDPGSLYLRPTMIGTDSALGVAPASNYIFFTLASPVGGYFGSVAGGGPASVSVLATSEFVRACPGGLGTAKTGANYAASLKAVAHAKKQGFNNVLFLDAIKHRYLEELSGMNVFVVEGGVLKTPKLGGTVLKGVTRDSLLKLAQGDGVRTEETDIDIEDLVAGFRAGRITEMFACGTGAAITAITELGWKGEKLAVGDKAPGRLTRSLYEKLIGIQAGRVKAPAADWLVGC